MAGISDPSRPIDYDDRGDPIDPREQQSVAWQKDFYPTAAAERDDSQSYHPSVIHLLDLFEYKHLPEHLQRASKPCHNLAHSMAAAAGGQGIELSAGLRHLLYAKDSFVRQAVIDAKERSDG